MRVSYHIMLCRVVIAYSADLLDGAKVFEPFNTTASDETVKYVDEAFQPIRDMSPSSGAYLNEVSCTLHVSY